MSNKLLPVEDFSASGLDKKRQQVVEAAVHSWKAYEEHAWGFDELQPLTQDGKETLGGLGATIVDSLDTLWLMGLKDEFGRLVLAFAFDSCSVAPQMVCACFCKAEISSTCHRKSYAKVILYVRVTAVLLHHF